MTQKGQRSLRMGNAIHCRKSENLIAVFIHERSLSMLNDHKCTYNIANHKCSKHSIEHSWLAPADYVHGRQTESPFLSIDYAYTLRPDIIQETGTSILLYSETASTAKPIGDAKEDEVTLLTAALTLTPLPMNIYHPHAKFFSRTRHEEHEWWESA